MMAGGRGRKRARSTAAATDADVNSNTHAEGPTQEDKEQGSPPKQKKINISDTPVKENVHIITHSSHRCLPGCVLTLGEGDTGQLGLGEDVMERTKPAKVDIDAEIVQVTAGGMHSVCLTSDGKVYTFGCNDEGALGRKTSDEDECMNPYPVELDQRIVYVCAGDSHTAALSQSGSVFIWGTFRDANGPLGLLPDGSKSELPVAILPGQTVAKISSGSDHLVCLTDDGEIFTFGCAEQGQLGRVAECFSARGGRKGLSLILTPRPVRVTSRKVRFDNIWTGSYVTYAKAKSTGDIYAWGLNNYFQLGFADMVNRFVPDLVKSFPKEKDWQEISGGQHHAIALAKDGGVYSLGRSEYGRLGLGEDTKDVKEPTLVTALKDIPCVSINAGSAVSFAVAKNGIVYAWGMGTNKQTGQPDEEDLFEPTVLTGKQLNDRNAVMVSAGGQHTVILAKDKS